jgi:hypothetical protein
MTPWRPPLGIWQLHGSTQQTPPSTVGQQPPDAVGGCKSTQDIYCIVVRLTIELFSCLFVLLRGRFAENDEDEDKKGDAVEKLHRGQ